MGHDLVTACGSTREVAATRTVTQLSSGHHESVGAIFCEDITEVRQTVDTSHATQTRTHTPSSQSPDTTYATVTMRRAGLYGLGQMDKVDELGCCQTCIHPTEPQFVPFHCDLPVDLLSSSHFSQSFSCCTAFRRVSTPVGMYAAPTLSSQPGTVQPIGIHEAQLLYAQFIHDLSRSARHTNQIRTPVAVMEEAREKASESWTRSSFLRLQRHTLQERTHSIGCKCSRCTRRTVARSTCHSSSRGVPLAPCGLPTRCHRWKCDRNLMCILSSTSELSPWKLLVVVCVTESQLRELEDTELGFHSSATEDDHVALWLTLVNKIRQPGGAPLALGHGRSFARGVCGCSARGTEFSL